MTEPDLSHVGPRDKAEILAQALPTFASFMAKRWSSSTVATP